MAAFIVGPSAPDNVAAAGARLNIFPGSATPAMFQANVPFWIGYGFVTGDANAGAQGESPLEPETRFELELDGEAVQVVTDVRIEDGRTVRKVDVATFGSGLPAGWHRFTARWYDAGALVLTCQKAIQFVDR